ncbi:MAG TPA: hypothetical protein VMW92_05470 [Candidatus Heimdallarchaeota archaeon]|nr:hypothetical protein [Candidatus Heimdallarchaeota archaeon]
MGTKSRYNQVDGAILRRLIDISGPNAVMNDDEAREKYSTKEEIFQIVGRVPT